MARLTRLNLNVQVEHRVDDEERKEERSIERIGGKN